MVVAASARGAEAASKPVCEHENGRLLLQRHEGGTPEEEAEATRTLSERLHVALMEWSAAPGGCRGEVVIDGGAHCGKVRTVVMMGCGFPTDP